MRKSWSQQIIRYHHGAARRLLSMGRFRRPCYSPVSWRALPVTVHKKKSRTLSRTARKDYKLSSKGILAVGLGRSHWSPVPGAFQVCATGKEQYFCDAFYHVLGASPTTPFRRILCVALACGSLKRLGVQPQLTSSNHKLDAQQPRASTLNCSGAPCESL